MLQHRLPLLMSPKLPAALCQDGDCTQKRFLEVNRVINGWLMPSPKGQIIWRSEHCSSSKSTSSFLQWPSPSEMLGSDSETSSAKSGNLLSFNCKDRSLSQVFWGSPRGNISTTGRILDCQI